uniref:DUF5901 domain-containing protein n=1 Tax=viral metagenome TaxID=1070528 RepID=A0A6C0DSB3_9ZZZZ
MSFYNDNKELFLDPTTKQYGSHMVMTNVKKETKVKYINIDTRFRDEYNYFDPVNYNLTLPERITDVKRMRVKSVEIPIVYYNISSQNSNNVFLITNTVTNTNYVITILDGYYSAQTLVTEINSELSKANITDITFSIVNNKSIFTVNSGSTNTYSIRFDVNSSGLADRWNVKNKLGWTIGFRKTEAQYQTNTTYVANYNISKTKSLTSDTFIDLNGPRYLYLAIDEFSRGNQHSFVSPIANSLINKNVIARIPIGNSVGFGNILSGSVENGTLLTDKREYTGKIDILKLNIQLLNESGANISLYGFDFSFCLEIEHE